MGFREHIRPRLIDWMMRQMNDLRSDELAEADGDVLEIGFGTGLNLDFYPPGVKSVTAVDPEIPKALPALESRISRAAFSVERCGLRADGALPFDAGRFDCVVATWTLCSLPAPLRALAEMRRLLKAGGRYLFIEHGLAPTPGTARWQNRLNPFWRRIADGCNMNRPIDELVERGGFALGKLERFRHKGPSVLSHMYRGVARREEGS